MRVLAMIVGLATWLEGGILIAELPANWPLPEFKPRPPRSTEAAPK